MSKFKLQEFRYIEGRGLIAVGDWSGELPKVGDQTTIDGDNYEIRGVEFYRTLLYPQTIGKRIGLLVKKLGVNDE